MPRTAAERIDKTPVASGRWVSQSKWKWNATDTGFVRN